MAKRKCCDCSFYHKGICYLTNKIVNPNSTDCPNDKIMTTDRSKCKRCALYEPLMWCYGMADNGCRFFEPNNIEEKPPEIPGLWEI